MPKSQFCCLGPAEDWGCVSFFYLPFYHYRMFPVHAGWKDFPASGTGAYALAQDSSKSQLHLVATLFTHSHLTVFPVLLALLIFRHLLLQGVLMAVDAGLQNKLPSMLSSSLSLRWYSWDSGRGREKILWSGYSRGWGGLFLSGAATMVLQLERDIKCQAKVHCTMYVISM